MKRLFVLVAFCVAFSLLLIAGGCEWNVPNEDTESEDSKDCSLNPGIPGYDCGDACCNWADCGTPRVYEDYGDCVARCNEAIYIDLEEPIYDEGYKNCVLDCVYDCGNDDDCRVDCKDQFINE